MKYNKYFNGFYGTLHKNMSVFAQGHMQNLKIMNRYHKEHNNIDKNFNNITMSEQFCTKGAVL